MATRIGKVATVFAEPLLRRLAEAINSLINSALLLEAENVVSGSIGFSATTINSGIRAADTRDIDSTPSELRSQPGGLSFSSVVRWDVKAQSSFATPLPVHDSHYAGLYSFSPWADDTGGSAYQLAFYDIDSSSDPGFALRRGTTAFGWTGWYPLAFVQSGVTTARPITPLTGQSFFDTTLGKPIWYSGSGWVDATGTAA